jgi:cobyrinic acid a,c-diamide synthase
MLKVPRILISGERRSSGKTTVSCGLTSALKKRGLSVSCFKKGPDYIDPMWLSSASCSPCYNLDFFIMGEERILESFTKRAEKADFAIIEGNMGLFDGIATEGVDSTAHLAQVLGSPTILVIDASRITRGIAALILGYQHFEPDFEIAGVILNKVVGDRHREKLLSAIKEYCDVEVLGVLPKRDEIRIPERHLGLLTRCEADDPQEKVERIAEVVEECVDVERIIEIAKRAEALEYMPEIKSIKRQRVRIGVARDPAFCFYYPDNLEALENAGAELVFFNTLKDSLPDVDALIFGGGFPEIFMDRLSENRVLRTQIKDAVEDGMCVYAECGGLIYLAETVSWNGRRREMVGAIPAEIQMFDRPKGHGYVILEKDGNSRLALPKIKGHEFHHSEIVNPGHFNFGYKVIRGRGVDGEKDGIIYKNLIASYTHIHSAGTPDWAENFVELADSCK